MSSNIGRKERNERAATSYSTDSYVDAYQNLPGRAHADKAIPLLQKIASLVKPIMRSHEWRLPLLSEFFPDNPALVGLNVNGGQQILLRLRPHWAPNTFYSEDELIGVMLHELTHNVHGPHDDRFYKYLAGLESEYADLQRSGYAGEGFFAPGQKLAEGVSMRNVPMTEARKRAIVAAERRARLAGAGGVNKLGGKGWTVRDLMKTPGQLAAEAAERRMKDDKSCAHDHSNAEQEASKAAQEGSRHDAVDLKPVGHDDVIEISSDEDSDIELLSSTTVAGKGEKAGEKAKAAVSSTSGPKSSTSSAAAASSKASEPIAKKPKPNPAPSSSSTTAPSAPVPRRETRPSSSVSTPAPPPVPTNSHPRPAPPSPAPAPEPVVEPEFIEWPCDACTYVNHPQRTTCEICSTPKSSVPPPSSIPSAPLSPSIPAGFGAFPQPNSNPRLATLRSEDPTAWDCTTCGEKAMPGNFWTCRFCGSVKTASV